MVLLMGYIPSSSSSSSSLKLQPVAMTERDKSRYTEGSVNIGGSVGSRKIAAVPKEGPRSALKPGLEYKTGL
ncbi:hypothetical protein EVAR_79677_1 [Eumeta japonica]|uniref:Uncharacterized protein n=1 Tax=Eumeta variegata TaxID=151549 RepID=A0A4C1W8X7_EUMVA|nr:hypothetical protein EVAR_79677_1 [Eumeta japonica]